MDILQPGPMDNSILYEQENHISERVWHGKVSIYWNTDVLLYCLYNYDITVSLYIPHHLLIAGSRPTTMHSYAKSR